jgi:4-oxalocrotonate tautomerase
LFFASMTASQTSINEAVMPFLRITLSMPELAAETTQALARDAARVTAEILGKKIELTSVLVEYPQSGRWLVGGQAPERCAHFEILITEGTNTVPQKSAYLETINALLHRHAGVLPEATYTVIRDIPAEDWGYNGKSQASRRG